MDAKIAAQMCFPFIDECDSLPEEHDQWGKDHLRYMVEEIMKMDCPDKDAKRKRLSGWVDEIAAEEDMDQRIKMVNAMIDDMLVMCKSTEKAMRWLGWLQCALSMGGGASLEEMKQINLKA